MKTVSWSDVMAIHGSQAGLRIRDGRVLSLLVSQRQEDAYLNEVSKEKIIYHIRCLGRHGQRWAELMMRAVGTSDNIRVFRKLEINKWEDLGAYQVRDAEGGPNEEDVFFVLTPASTLDGR